MDQKCLNQKKKFIFIKILFTNFTHSCDEKFIFASSIKSWTLNDILLFGSILLRFATEILVNMLCTFFDILKNSMSSGLSIHMCIHSTWIYCRVLMYITSFKYKTNKYSFLCSVLVVAFEYCKNNKHGCLSVRCTSIPFIMYKYIMHTTTTRLYKCMFTILLKTIQFLDGFDVYSVHFSLSLSLSLFVFR